MKRKKTDSYSCFSEFPNTNAEPRMREEMKTQSFWMSTCRQPTRSERLAPQPPRRRAALEHKTAALQASTGRPSDSDMTRWQCAQGQVHESA